MKLLGVGFYIGGSILLGVVVGLWLDNQFGNRFPIMTIVGLFLGLLLAGYGVYRMLLPLLGSREEKGKK